MLWITTQITEHFIANSLNTDCCYVPLLDQEEFQCANVIFRLVKIGSRVCARGCDIKRVDQGKWGVRQGPTTWKISGWLAAWDWSGGEIASLQKGTLFQVRLFTVWKHTHFATNVVRYSINPVYFLLCRLK